MNLTNWIFGIILGFSITSCCTKKDCDQDYFPKIIIEYTGINDSILIEKMIYVLDKKTLKLIDSAEISNHNNCFVIDKWFMNDMFGDKREFKQYDYVVKISDRLDSLTDIKYERTTEIIDCNDCFPVGDGSAMITNFTNLEFKINQEIYLGNDTVTIEINEKLN